MNEPDRRHETRVPVEMWVEEKSADATYFDHAANLSRGGIFLPNCVPHPEGTRMLIRFTLPGDQAAIETSALIVRIETGAELGMHLKFEDLNDDAAARIDHYVEHVQKS